MAAFMNIKSIDLANALCSVFDPTELRSYQSFTIFLPKSNNKMSDKPVTYTFWNFGAWATFKQQQYFLIIFRPESNSNINL